MSSDAFPHDLRQKPQFHGEAVVFDALRVALDESWEVYYDRPIVGSRRRIDFLAACRCRGVIAWEVKGGLVHDRKGQFRQLIRRSGQRKVVDPFRQLRWSTTALLAASGMAPGQVPMHLAIWFPDMAQRGLRWKMSDHIWTRELLAPELIRLRVDTMLPASDKEELPTAVDRLLQGFVRR